MEQKILFIAGMHRSGTSMLAKWLHQMGINLGEALLEANQFNPKGYYEDKEIVKILESQLEELNFESTGTKLSGKIHDLNFSPRVKNEIKDWIDKHKNLAQWGWKEPRSTLFLLEWKRLIPNLTCIAIYRHYANVIESLERRNYYSLFWTKNFSPYKTWFYRIFYFFYIKKLRNQYLNAWILYNKQIINFKENFKEDCIILEAGKIVNEHKKIFDWLTNKGFKTNYIDIKKIFDTSLFHKNKPHLWGVNKFSEQKAKTIFNELYENSIHNHTY